MKNRGKLGAAKKKGVSGRQHRTLSLFRVPELPFCFFRFSGNCQVFPAA